LNRARVHGPTDDLSHHVLALDTGVLRRLARCDTRHFDAVTIGPADEVLSGELRTAVGPKRIETGTFFGDLIQHRGTDNLGVRQPWGQIYTKL